MCINIRCVCTFMYSNGQNKCIIYLLFWPIEHINDKQKNAQKQINACAKHTFRRVFLSCQDLKAFREKFKCPVCMSPNLVKIAIQTAKIHRVPIKLTLHYFAYILTLGFSSFHFINYNIAEIILLYTTVFAKLTFSTFYKIIIGGSSLNFNYIFTYFVITLQLYNLDQLRPCLVLI